MNKDYTKKFQHEIIKIHILITASCFVFILCLYFYMDYFYNGAFINFLQEFFGWDFAHFALRNQRTIIFMIIMMVILLNSIIVEIYAIQKISRVFSQIQILFQKDDQRIVLDESLYELENDLNALKRESIENEKKAVNYATLRNTTLRRSALSFAATKSELDTGEPIYIQLAWNVGGAHAVVVSGYNTSAGTLTIVDPAKGCGTKSFSYNSMITGCTFQSGTGKWSNSITI